MTWPKKAIKKSKSFNPLGNIEFEALWNALDRDNETQYRLLFTPLAQTQLKDVLLDNKVGFGDDFYMVKDGMLNKVEPNHFYGIWTSPAILIISPTMKSINQDNYLTIIITGTSNPFSLDLSHYYVFRYIPHELSTKILMTTMSPSGKMNQWPTTWEMRTSNILIQ